MLTKVKWIVLLWATSWLVVPQAQADESSDARRSITQAYKQLDAATARKDYQTILSFVGPSYQFTISGKTYDRPHFVKDANRLLSAAKTLKVQTSITKFVLKQGKATVMAREIAYVTIIGTGTHKISSIRTDSIFKDVWIRQQGRWLKRKTTNYQFKATVDGKSVKPTFAK